MNLAIPNLRENTHMFVQPLAPFIAIFCKKETHLPSLSQEAHIRIDDRLVTELVKVRDAFTLILKVLNIKTYNGLQENGMILLSSGVFMSKKCFIRKI